MKKYVFLSVFLCFCFACTLNHHQKVVSTPQPIDQVYTPMLQSLDELGYKVQNTRRKSSRSYIVAMKIFPDEGYALRPNISFTRQNQVTFVEISIQGESQKKIDKHVLDYAVEEIAKKLEEKIGMK